MCNGSGSAKGDTFAEGKLSEAIATSKAAQERFLKLQEQNKAMRKEYFDLRRAGKKETDPDKRMENFKTLYRNQMDRAALRAQMNQAADERNSANSDRGVWEHALGK